MFWTRVDNRLVHGQIIETWLPFTRATCLVVANDELSQDVLKQEIMSLAIPQDVNVSFISVESLSEKYKCRGVPFARSNMLVLFSNCRDAVRAFEQGFVFVSLNIGNLHYSPGKKQIAPNVALSRDDEDCLRYFDDRGVELDFRCIPTERVQVKQVW